VLSREHQFAVIEGAGGWRVPLGPRETLADLAITLGLPVVLVVGVRLGCINHALLTVEAIRRDGLRLAGWVANQVEPPMPRCKETIDTLKQWLGAPCVGVVPFSGGLQPHQVAHHLDISLLAGR
jgi:dethiobiotin synthetase